MVHDTFVRESRVFEHEPKRVVRQYVEPEHHHVTHEVSHYQPRESHQHWIVNETTEVKESRVFEGEGNRVLVEKRTFSPGQEAHVEKYSRDWNEYSQAAYRQN